jgi:hypothetical protein
MFADVGGGLHPVHLPLEHDVHHDQIGTEPACLLDGIQTAQRRADNLTAEVREALGNVVGNDGFVIDDEDTAVHAGKRGNPGGGKRLEQGERIRGGLCIGFP